MDACSLIPPNFGISPRPFSTCYLRYYWFDLLLLFEFGESSFYSLNEIAAKLEYIGVVMYRSGYV